MEMVNNKYIYTVKTKRRLNRSTVDLTLCPVNAKELLKYAAGQYIMIIGANGESRYYSIAVAPQDSGEIQLHVHAPDESHLAKTFPGWPRVELFGPYGECKLCCTQRPLLLIAGGTGFSQIKSIAEQSIEHAPNREVSLIWAARFIDDLYYLDKIKQWQKRVSNLEFFPILSRETTQTWAGMRGHATELLRNIQVQEGAIVFVCGGQKFTHAVSDTLEEIGVEKSRIHSDLLLSYRKTAAR